MIISYCFQTGPEYYNEATDRSDYDCEFFNYEVDYEDLHDDVIYMFAQKYNIPLDTAKEIIGDFNLSYDAYEYFEDEDDFIEYVKEKYYNRAQKLFYREDD